MIPRGILPALPYVIAGGLLFWVGRDCGRSSAEARAEQERDRADSLALVLTVASARADGWAATWAAAVPHALEGWANADSQAARLARELEAARARPVRRTVVTTEASGGPVPPETVFVATGDSAVALFRDGALVEQVSYVRRRQPRWQLDWWTVETVAELVHAESSGRLAVFARSLDPGVTITVDTLVYELPEPPEEPGFPWRCLGGAGAAGAAAGVELRRWLADDASLRWQVLGPAAIAALLACR